MKKRPSKRLQFHRETLRNLDSVTGAQAQKSLIVTVPICGTIALCETFGGCTRTITVCPSVNFCVSIVGVEPK